MGEGSYGGVWRVGLDGREPFGRPDRGLRLGDTFSLAPFIAHCALLRPCTRTLARGIGGILSWLLRISDESGKEYVRLYIQL